jgi:hypothetical protein
LDDGVDRPFYPSLLIVGGYYDGEINLPQPQSPRSLTDGFVVDYILHSQLTTKCEELIT